MDFYEVLESRHSVREFLKKDIEQEKLARIIGAVMKAPSAGNLQAYQLYAIRSEDARKALVAAAMGQDFLAEAPVVLAFFADKKVSESKYGERGANFYAVQDATIAAAYSQLAAAAEGISSVWVGAFDPLEVSFIVKAEQEQTPVALIALGYKSGDARVTSRRPLEEMVKEV